MHKPVSHPYPFVFNARFFCAITMLWMIRKMHSMAAMVIPVHQASSNPAEDTMFCIVLRDSTPVRRKAAKAAKKTMLLRFIKDIVSKIIMKKSRTRFSGAAVKTGELLPQPSMAI